MKNIFILICSFLFLTNARAEHFRVTVVGEGRPMLLLPGHSCSGEVWASTVDHYKERFRCHVVTLAGFAGVPPQDGPFLEGAVAELSAYIKAQGLQRPVVVGHSLGGTLALLLASREPEAVGALVIVDSLPFLAGIQNPAATQADADRMAEQFEQALTQVDAATYRDTVASGRFTRSLVNAEADHARIVEWGLATDRATAIRAMGELHRLDLRPSLPAIQAPTLVFVGAKFHSQFYGLAAVESLFRTQYAGLPGVTLAVSAEANHFVMYDAPEWMFAAMDTFLLNDARR